MFAFPNKWSNRTSNIQIQIYQLHNEQLDKDEI